ncbi:murein-DD-endopeptidase [Klebsiella grimontii]|uniref:Murein-DD-endopeptidase n=1 Tax=Klebsiella grimontii TaxID=2058152 RepID=A0A7H4P035_9ENTR|nr:murein-DD-endopeptidase [Klebsiella grimontii]
MFTMTKFRVSLLSLTLLLAVPFAPQAMAKTSTAVTASQPDIASGSAMIVDLASKKNHLCQPAGSGSPDGVDHEGDDRDGGA